MNTYLYANANPVRYTDPEGLFAGITAMVPSVGGGDVETDAMISEAQAEGVIAAGVVAATLPAVTLCSKVRGCRDWAQKAKEKCKNIRCKLEIHDAHHKFGPRFNSRLPHIQLTCWIKGQKGSTRIFRIPLPQSMNPRK